MRPQLRSNRPLVGTIARSSRGSLVFGRENAFMLFAGWPGAEDEGEIMSTGGGTAAILTDRLRLRPYELADFDRMHQLMGRAEAFPFPARAGLDEEEVWSRLLRHIGSWSALGLGFFAVEEITTGAFVGEAGFTWFRRGAGSEYGSAPEATWTIAPDYQGRGYAGEAAAAAQRWIETERGLTRTLCAIHPDNAPSLSIAGKLGYREIGRVMFRGHPAIFLERRAQDL